MHARADLEIIGGAHTAASGGFRGDGVGEGVRVHAPLSPPLCACMFNLASVTYIN